MKFSACIFILLTFGCSTLHDEDLIQRFSDGQHGWHHPSGYQKMNSEKATPESLARGEDLYRQHCLPCHGTSGRGDGYLAHKLVSKPADLRNLQGDRSDFHIYLQISLGNGSMPGRQDLEEKKRWDLVNYIQLILTKSEGSQTL